MRIALLSTLIALLAACGTSATGLPDGSAPLPDAGTLTEQEPNDGNATGEENPMPVPGEMAGTLSSATDIDIFQSPIAGGQLLTWRLEPKTTALTPYLGIVEQNDSVPHMVVKGNAGAAIEQEQYVLSTSIWFAIVKDARATPPGPGGEYLLTVQPTSREPTALTFPSTVQGTLRHRTAVALYKFHATRNVGFDLVVNCARKSPASDMDSRISLWDLTNQRWLATNDDDAAAATTDSHLFSDGLPTDADLVLVVENVSETAQDLSFELQAALK